MEENIHYPSSPILRSSPRPTYGAYESSSAIDDGKEQSLWEETRELVQLSWPVSLSSACRVLMALTDVAVLGLWSSPADPSQSTRYIAAAALAWVYMDFGWTFAWSSADAINALCAQAFGAKNMPLVGRWFQTGIVCSSIMSLLVCLSFVVSGPFLVALGTAPDVAALAQRYAYFAIPAVLPGTLYYALRQYFQAQGIVKPAMVFNALSVIVNLVLNLIFVYLWGFDGSAIATTLSRTLQSIAFYVYMFQYKHYHDQTWPIDGWNWNAVLERKHLLEFGRQAVPTTLTNALQAWQLEVITLFAARLGNVEVATNASLFNLFFVLNSIAFGIQKATGVRVGFHLGASHPQTAAIAAQASGIIALALGIFVAVVLYICRKLVGHVYSNDPHIWMATSSVTWIVAIGYIVICLSMSMIGIIQGQGRPSSIAIIGIISSCFIAVPTAYVLAFPMHLNLDGLWMGDVAGYTVLTILTAQLVIRTDWFKMSKEATDRASNRIGRASLSPGTPLLHTPHSSPPTIVIRSPRI